MLIVKSLTCKSEGKNRYSRTSDVRMKCEMFRLDCGKWNWCQISPLMHLHFYYFRGTVPDGKDRRQQRQNKTSDLSEGKKADKLELEVNSNNHFIFLLSLSTKWRLGWWPIVTPFFKYCRVPARRGLQQTARGSDKTQGQGSFGPSTGGPDIKILKRNEPHIWFAFFTKTGWAWHVPTSRWISSQPEGRNPYSAPVLKSEGITQGITQGITN